MLLHIKTRLSKFSQDSPIIDPLSIMKFSFTDDAI